MSFARPTPRRLLFAAALVALALPLAGAYDPKPARTPVRGTWAAEADSLIQPGEKHFRRLWQLTFGGENAEAYWSSDGKRLILQSTRDGYPCDRIYTLELASGKLGMVSTGTGRTTCAYYYDRDRRIVYASTHLGGADCPPPPDQSKGYVWPLTPSYDLFTARADGSDIQRLTDSPRYDAEATVSVDQRWILFTSLRTGDLELFKMRPDGSELTQLTSDVGYDGGAFFSRDGRWICWRRSNLPDEAAVKAYQDLLREDMVRPSAMDLWVMRADGTGKRQVTRKPGASFAPYFTPDNLHLIYSSNWENPRGRDFELYLVGVDGGEPERVTRYPEFDGFPMFSPDGRFLVFCSNRGGKVRGETNVFLAEWK